MCVHRADARRIVLVLELKEQCSIKDRLCPVMISFRVAQSFSWGLFHIISLAAC